MKCTPRWYVAAAKPVMSPITPPPSATNVVCVSHDKTTFTQWVPRQCGADGWWLYAVRAGGVKAVLLAGCGAVGSLMLLCDLLDCSGEV